MQVDSSLAASEAFVAARAVEEPYIETDYSRVAVAVRDSGWPAIIVYRIPEAAQRRPEEMPNGCENCSPDPSRSADPVCSQRIAKSRVLWEKLHHHVGKKANARLLTGSDHRQRVLDNTHNPFLAQHVSMRGGGFRSEDAA
jgi:hypothetical protein